MIAEWEVGCYSRVEHLNSYSIVNNTVCVMGPGNRLTLIITFAYQKAQNSLPINHISFCQWEQFSFNLSRFNTRYLSPTICTRLSSSDLPEGYL